MGTNSRDPFFGYEHLRSRIAGLVQELAEARATVAEAVVAEREGNCMAVCQYCQQKDADWIEPAERRAVYNWGERWVHHLRLENDKWCYVHCDAAAIRARGEEGDE